MNLNIASIQCTAFTSECDALRKKKKKANHNIDVSMIE